jgi:hypothetical protein
MAIRDLFWPEAPMGRGNYALIGIIGCAAKYGLDYEFATRVFHREWGLSHYWMPLGRTGAILSAVRGDAWFLLTMVALALPFIWIGTICTARRLWDARLPSICVALFFLPMVNLLFFLVLCTVPTQRGRATGAVRSDGTEARSIGNLIPRGGCDAALLATFFPAALGLCFVILSVDLLSSYGWGVFVALPFCMGFLSVMIFNFHEQRSLNKSLGISALSSVVLAGLLLFLGKEGAGCLVMVAPLAGFLGMFGGFVGYGMRMRSWALKHRSATFSIILLLTPGIITLEKATHPVAPRFEVKTSIEINAPPETIWKQVVAFSQIPDPHEWLFRSGIAYPERAEIFGQGVGGERHCVFSTGSFIEPIQVWDEPRLLRFSVTANPPPMREWSPYSNIQPPHLHGFFVSDGGQFLLTALPGGRTRLEGTTWYRHTIWPTFYWRNWSDYIIHRIHLRVLRHIEALATGDQEK